MMFGRRKEQAQIDRLLMDAATGSSAALVVRGEPGIGKSTLLEHARKQAGELSMRVLGGVGVQAEIELPYSALSLVLRPAVHHLDTLPSPQADALRGALGLAGFSATDRFLVGLATLTLLAEHAEDGPLLCVVDDAHWLDQSSVDALRFAARRLGAEGIVMLFAVRTDETGFPADGLPELHVDALGRDESMSLLKESAPDLSPQIRDRIVAEAGGNPLALRELPAALTAEQRAGWVTATASPARKRPIASRVQEAFQAQVLDLPETTRSLLLVLAIEDVGNLAVVLDAAGRLGADLADLERAETAQLVQGDCNRLDFRHPLIRSATYNTATVRKRMVAHRALAEAFETAASPDRAAWHRAAATTAPDEAVASALEDSAIQARSRGGWAAVAAAYQRAAELTPDVSRRVRRMVSAAHAAADAGHPVRAAELVDQAEPHTTDPVVRAELAQIRSAIAHEQDHHNPAVELAQAAAAIVELDPEQAAIMFLNAVTGTSASGNRADAAAVARFADVRSSDPILSHVCQAVVNLASDQPHRGIRHLHRLLEDYPRDSEGNFWPIRWWFDWLADADAAYKEAVAFEQSCRLEAAIGVLPRALTHLARAQLRRGSLRAAKAAAAEGLEIAQDTRQTHFAGHLSGLLACATAIEGDEERTRELAGSVLDGGMTERGVESLRALNILDLGLGAPEAVLARLDQLAVGPVRGLALGHFPNLPDYVEAGARAGRQELAEEASRRFGEWAEATQRPWARAVALRCRAIVDDGDGAADLYEAAVALHAEDGQPFERARTELLFGIWLRRRLRHKDARPHLRVAYEIFDHLGAAMWTQRAGNELRAAGEALDSAPHGPDLLDRLTPQELQVARLAAQGLSNRDIAAQLFLSPRTVGYHLYKAYPKLGVASRYELTRIDLG
jgi:DNA-binding CsgD family transcriptional regulator